MTDATMIRLVQWSDALRPVWLELLFGSTLILLAAGVICLCLSRKAAALRCRVWTLAMIGLLCFPMLSLCVPRLSPLFLAGNISFQESMSEESPMRFDRSMTVATPISASDDIVTAPETTVVGTQPLELTSADHEIFSRRTQFDTETTTISTEPSQQVGENLNVYSEANAPAQIVAANTPASDVQEERQTSQKSTVAFFPVLMFVWCCGVLPACTMLLRSWLVSRYVFRNATLPDNPTWQREIDAISEKIGLRRTVIALICPSTPVPFVAGFMQKAVFLPPQCDAWDAGQRQAVLVHELTHVLRGDITLQLITRIAGMAYWFQPLYWFAARQIRIEREMACDDAVLLFGERPSRYATMLLSVAASLKSQSRSTVGLSISMARRSRVERRIRSILRTGRNRMPVGRKSALLLMLAIGVIVTGAAMFSPFEPPKFFVSAQAAMDDNIADAEISTKTDEISASEETAELHKTLENRLQASRDEVAACEEAYIEGRLDAEQYLDARKRLLQAELELLELFPDSVIEDYSKRVPIAAVPVSREATVEKIRALENQKLAAREKLRSVYEAYITGHVDGTVANMADACYDFIDSQIEMCEFLLGFSLEEPQKSQLLQSQEELYAKAHHAASVGLQAHEALFDVGRGLYAETAKARQRLTELELRMIERAPNLKIEKPENDFIKPDWVKALLKSDVPTVEIRWDRQPLQIQQPANATPPMRPDVFIAKKRALTANYKAAFSAHERIRSYHAVGDPRGTNEKEAQARREVFSAQMELAKFLQDATSSDEVKRELHRELQKLCTAKYVAEKDWLYAMQKGFDVGGYSRTDVLAVQKLLPETELKLVELFPDLRLFDENGEFLFEKIAQVLPQQTPDDKTAPRFRAEVEPMGEWLARIETMTAAGK